MSRKIKMQIKAFLWFGISAVVGVLLAGFVYSGMEAVKVKTHELTKNSIPSMMLVRKFGMLLSEQERVLYEYYATTETSLYEQQYLSLIQQLRISLDELANLSSGKKLKATLERDLQHIVALSKILHSNLSSLNVDWDLARNQLQQLSSLRRQMLPKLDNLVIGISKSVDVSYKMTLDEIYATSLGVISFSIGLILISLVMGRYAANYICLSAENERLAKFPLRNPNPIISLSADFKVNYQNPATKKLLQEMKLPANPMALLSDKFADELRATRHSNPPVRFYHNQIAQRFLRYEVHWLEDASTYDIHVQDMTKQKKAKDLSTYHAYHHDLSGLSNRQRFAEHAHKAISQGGYFSAVLIELSHHSRLLGHVGIDGVTTIVKSLAKRLHFVTENWRSCFPCQGELYQIADANFALLIPLSSTDTAFLSLCESLVDSCGSPLNTKLGEMSVPVRLGVTEFPRNSHSVDDLLLHAKIAMDNSGESIAFFDHQIGDLHQRRVTLNNRLEQAIDNGELQLYFQPQWQLNNDSVAGAETLLRWNLDGQFISPAEFIPLAEQSGFILTLGDWVLENAVQKTAYFERIGLGIKRIAVNISARQLMQNSFVERVIQLLEKYQLKPELLELEMTETMVMDNGQEGLLVLARLKALGICLAIDDFGTGYSSLAYLKEFPVDKLKIDQSFIKSMHNNRNDQAIVISLCQMARNLGLKIVAEGVEEAEQVTLLRNYRCDVIQGYLYSTPLTESDFVEFVSKNQLVS